MSKLFEKIECLATGHRTPMPRNLSIEVEDHVSLVGGIDHLETYRFLVRISTEIKMPYYTTDRGLRDAKQYASSQAIRYMQQWVFDEFLGLIEEARHAAFNYDRDGTIVALDSLQRRMTKQ